MTLGLEATCHPHSPLRSVVNISPAKFASPRVRRGKMVYEGTPTVKSSRIAQPDALAKKTGRIELIQAIKGRRIHLTVILKVYSNAFGRYAVVAQDRLPLVKDCGFINLRNCTIKREATGFTIIPLNGEKQPLEFRAIEGTAHEWFQVLDSESDAKSDCLSCVCETDIEEVETNASSPIPIQQGGESCHVRSRSRSPLTGGRSPPGALQASGRLSRRSDPRPPGLPCLSEDDGEDE